MSTKAITDSGGITAHQGLRRRASAATARREGPSTVAACTPESAAIESQKGSTGIQHRDSREGSCPGVDRS